MNKPFYWSVLLSFGLKEFLAVIPFGYNCIYSETSLLNLERNLE